MVDALTKKIPLMEVFGPTIQGEGAVIGQQTYFIRLGLCDYKCQMCDSMHAVDPIQVSDNAEWLTQEQILQKFFSHTQLIGTNWVTLSGGNPAIHDLYWLVDHLKQSNFNIAVETQGTFAPSWLLNCDIITCSPKGPGMGERFEEERFVDFLEHFHGMTGYYSSLNIKVVLFNDADIAFATRVATTLTERKFPLSRLYLSQGNPYPPGYQSPNSAAIPESPQVLRSILAKRYLDTFEKLKEHPLLSNCKFLPQFHVWLYGNKQGV